MRISVFLVTILLSFNACAFGSGYVRGPSPKYSNLSDKPIYDIKVKAENTNLIGWPELGPGLSAYVSNDIKNKNDIYGDIIVSWKNAAGKDFTRTFNFTENDWKETYHNGKSLGAYLVFEFIQNKVEYYTSAEPDYRERGKKSAKIMSAIKLKIDKSKQ